MNNNTFDERLKSALENIEAPYDPETWSALAARMDGFATTDGTWMDEPLAEKLSQMEVPYQPMHWEKMAVRLEVEENRRRRVWMYKIAEAAVLLLLIANVLYMTQGFDPDGGPTALKKTKHSGQRIKKSGHDNMATATTVAEAGLHTTVADLVAFATNMISVPNTPQIPDASSTALTNAVLSPNTITGGLKTLLDDHAAMAAILQQTGQSLPGVELYPLVSAGVHQPESLPMIKKTSKTPGRFFAGISTGVQFDRIHNGTDNTLANQQMALDADVLYKKGKWGVSTGVRYARKRFQPKPQIEIYAGDPAKGFYGSYISEVDASVMSIPVQATRRIARIGKATAHAVAGFTANVAVVKSYQSKTVYYPGQTPDPVTSGPTPVFNREANGWLENGALSDNHYISADAGLRVEAPISRRTTVFVESVYQHALSGNGFVNPPAKINTMGIYAGVVAGL
jgi:hypothetical protein